MVPRFCNQLLLFPILDVNLVLETMRLECYKDVLLQNITFHIKSIEYDLLVSLLKYDS